MKSTFALADVNLSLNAVSLFATSFLEASFMQLNNFCCVFQHKHLLIRRYD